MIRRLNQALLTLLLCISVVLMPLNTFAAESRNADNLINKISENIEYDGFRIELVDEVPDNVIPKEFDTIEDATVWLNELGNEFKEKDTSMLLTTPGFFDDGYVMMGEVGSCQYHRMPSGTGTIKLVNEYEVPGLSAQKVTSSHYFEYSANAVTKCVASASISGIGAATFKETYNELEKYVSGIMYNYYSVIIGDLGYYIVIDGNTIGAYQKLELTYCLFNPLHEAR